MVRSGQGTPVSAGEPEPVSDPGSAGQLQTQGTVAEERRDVRRVPIAQPSDPEEPGLETAIVLQVMAALLAEPPTELTVIEVNSKQGIVTLKGQVGSARLHTVAGEIASNHPGVEATVNDLEIHERGAPARGTDGPG